ncbi:MAG: hypothetical protein H7Y07_14710 [Pyrinomonadaceae bacterium]|nr:hypothetical protein [Sphingobacteriaceae bacterium]
MSKTFLILALTALTIVSCSKDKNDDNNNTGYHFSAKVDGVKKEFKTSVNAQLDGTSAQTGYNLFINGGGGTSSYPLPNFYVEVTADEPIVPKTYYTIPNQEWEAKGDYWTDAGHYDNDNLNFSITITSISSTEVRGTFSGTLEDDAIGQVITITEGSFSAPLVP